MRPAAGAARRPYMLQMGLDKRWMLVGVAALLLATLVAPAAGNPPGAVVTVHDGHDFARAFTNSSVGTIILAQDMQLDPADWEEYNVTSPYRLQRNLLIQGDNSTSYWMVLDFNAAQIYKKVLVDPHVNVSFVHMIGYQTRYGPGGDIDFFLASSGNGSVWYLHDFAKWQIACTPVSQAGILAYQRSPLVPGVQDVTFPDNVTLNNHTFFGAIRYTNFSTDVPSTSSLEGVQEGGYTSHKMNSYKVCDLFVSNDCIDRLGAATCVKDAMEAVLHPRTHATNTLGFRLGLGIGLPALIICAAVAGWLVGRRRAASTASRTDIDSKLSGADSTSTLQQIIVPGSSESRDKSMSSQGLMSLGTNMPDVLHGTCTKQEALRIQLGLLLGCGSYGKVFKGRHRDKTVAVKVIQHDRLMADRVRNEVELMLSFNHPYVVKALDFVTWGSSGVSRMSAADIRTLRNSAGTGSAAAGSGAEGAAAATPSASAPGRRSQKGSSSSSTSSGSPHGVETWVVLEYCNGGTLFDAAVRPDSILYVNDVMQVEVVLQLLLGIAQGMQYMHGLNVCHGDLKAANVLLMSNPETTPGASTSSPTPASSPSDGVHKQQQQQQQQQGAAACSGSEKNSGEHAMGSARHIAACATSHHNSDQTLSSGGARLAHTGVSYVPKIADFGLSRALNEGQTHFSTHTVGTITHQPPELMKTGRLAKPCDVYALGVLMWEVAARSSPWKGAMMGEVISNVLVDRLRPEFTVAPQAYIKLAQACWAQEPKDRPTFDSIVEQLSNMLRQALEMQAELEESWRELQGSW